MNKYAAFAASAVAMGAVVLGASAASANVTNREDTAPSSPTSAPWPDEGVGYPGYGMESSVPPAAPKGRSVGAVDQALQSGASALGGAGLALSGVWLYRRRHVPVH